MELILFIIFGGILLAQLGAEKGGRIEYKREMAVRKIEQDRFRCAVENQELEDEIRSNPFCQEYMDEVYKVFHTIPQLKNVELLKVTGNRNLVLLINMALQGKLPGYEGIWLPSFYDINDDTAQQINLTVDTQKVLGRWLQSQLRAHGVEAQIIYDKDKVTPLHWAPFYSGTTGEKL